MQAQVLAAIDNLLNAVDAYVAAITAQFSGGGPFPLTSDDTVKCEQLINAYNQGINTRSLDVGQAPGNVQNGYNVYLTAVPLFQEATHVWAEVCQAALASGEAKQIGDQDRGNISHQMGIIKNMLNNVANELRTP